MKEYLLVTREGNLYTKESFIDDSEPRKVSNWYPLSIPFENFRSWFVSEEAMNNKLNTTLQPVNNSPVNIWMDNMGWTYTHRLDSQNCRKPDFTEIQEIDQPVVKGRHLPLVWHKGAWCKQTNKGPVKLP